MSQENSSKLLYRLDSRNKITLLISFAPILLLLVFPTSFLLFDGGAKLAMGAVLAAILLYNLFEKLNFRYIAIYEDKIIIAKLFTKTQIARDEVSSCHFKSFPFMPYKVDIITKKERHKRKFYSIDALKLNQSKKICLLVLSTDLHYNI
ncbi:hypothetical protein [Campylobacter sp. RM16187]|uniref:hypothetical protein n=1 Tax=Campylobacter sp. RM16187 TaxID=1660063 RepID=UPI0021B501AF|nr:hypothetical protein [Campylobacter sp. RM16187]QKG29130.1 putative membrane protein [Campylobacter sp. RM16187]